jgi:hypothetical protein
VILAYSRPFWPLFLHVLGAMTLFGAVLTAALLAVAAWSRPLPALARATSWTLLVVALPAWVVTEIGAHLIESKEDLTHSNAAWLKIGMIVLEPGLIVLLVAAALAFWWARSGKPVAGRAVAGLTTIYLAMLVVAWLAMSAKWS